MSRFSKSVLESLESRVLLSAGDLDPSFNGGKLLTTQFSAGSSTMMDVAVLGDGGTVAAGHLANTDGTGFTSYQLALAKYHFDGTLDPSFGIGGEIVATPRGMTKAQEVQVGSDGSLLVFGQNAAGDCLIIKFSSSGKVDTTFAKNGALRLGSPLETLGFTLNSSDRMLVWGSETISPAANHVVEEGVLRRYTSSGAVDPSFDGSGQFIFLPPGATETLSQVRGMRLTSVSVDSAGRILVGAQDTLYASEGHGVHSPNVYIYRLTSAGKVDATFASSGKSQLADGSGAVAGLPANEQILVYTNDHLARLNSDGTVDSTYGTNGVTSFTANDDRGAVAPDGSAILALRVIDPHDENFSGFAIQRITPSGELDTTFGDNGTLTLASGVGDNGTTTVTMAPDGTVVMGGFVASASPSDFQAENNNFALARLFNADGPAVQLIPKTLRQGSRYLSMTVLIRDNDGVDASTLDDSDLKLFDAEGNTRKIRFLSSVDLNGDGKYLQATYRIIGPNSSAWSASANGTYQVRLQRKQIADTSANTAAAQVLGTVRVKIA